MKNNVRKALAISGLAIAIGTSGMILEASANIGSPFRGNRSHQERITKTRTVERRFVGRHAIFGTVTEMTDSAINITRGAKTYTVTTSATTKFVASHWKTMTRADIKVGDKLKVFGTIVDTNITAKTVRDISAK